MGKLNEVNEQTTQSWGNNSFTTTIKENTVEFDSARDSFTFKDEVNVPSLKIDGTQTEVYTEEEKEKLANLPTTITTDWDSVEDKPEIYKGYVETSLQPTTRKWATAAVGHYSNALQGYVAGSSDYSWRVYVTWNASSNWFNVPWNSEFRKMKGCKCVSESDDKEYIIEEAEANHLVIPELNVTTGTYIKIYKSQAVGNCSYIAGYHCLATGGASYARGENAYAGGSLSTAIGNDVQAVGNYQFVFGRSNTPDTITTENPNGKYIEIVGNGTSNGNRLNARTLDWDGNEQIKGTLRIGSTTTGGVMLKADSGTLKISFDDGATWLTVSAS